MAEGVCMADIPKSLIYFLDCASSVSTLRKRFEELKTCSGNEEPPDSPAGEDDYGAGKTGELSFFLQRRHHRGNKEVWLQQMNLREVDTHMRLGQNTVEEVHIHQSGLLLHTVPVQRVRLHSKVSGGGRMEEREICGSPGYTSLHHMPLQESGSLLGLERAHGERLSYGVSCCCSCRHLGRHVWISNTQQAVPSKAYSRRGLSSPPVMIF